VLLTAGTLGGCGLASHDVKWQEHFEAVVLLVTTCNGTCNAQTDTWGTGIVRTSCGLWALTSTAY
jgi:hypothetical protein